jgi:hypothetical protein
MRSSRWFVVGLHEGCKLDGIEVEGPDGLISHPEDHMLQEVPVNE